MTPQLAGVETWRGGVTPWQCDEMGHMNVRFYLAAATEGLAGLAACLAMPGAFSPTATSTLLVREHHIRFLKEARPGAGLILTGGVVEMGETDATLLQMLFHVTGEPAAAFTVKVSHVTPRELRPFPWNTATRKAAESLRLTPPDFAAPRGLACEPSTGAGLDAGRALPVSACGALGPNDCDVFGRMLPEHMLARIYASVGHVLRRSQVALLEAQPDLIGRLGGAAVEYRVVYSAWPKAGDRIELRSGHRDLTPKSRTVTHWLLDPASGRPYAAAEMISLFLDLKARKSLTLSQAGLDAMAIAPNPALVL